MALIELHSHRTAVKDQDTYVDLETGVSAHQRKPNELRRLPGASSNAILATDIDGLGLRIASVGRTDFDKIDYQTAVEMGDGAGFMLKEIDQLTQPEDSSFIVRIDTSPWRYFKVSVRRGEFSSPSTTLEFEELVDHRVIWPLRVNLSGDTLTVENSIHERKIVASTDRELLFSLRPRPHVEHTDASTSVSLASEFFAKPFPIVKVEFLASDGNPTQPKWLESVQISTNFSKSYINSTYLIRINEPGRPAPGAGNAENKFNVSFSDRGRSIEIWDPTVVVEDQEVL